MNQELLTKLKHKKEVKQRWKQRQETLQEYTIQACTDGVKKSKAHLEVNLTWHMKGNQKSFY